MSSTQDAAAEAAMVGAVNKMMASGYRAEAKADADERNDLG